ncbi:MAG: Rieske 2Fe-2S domain-containing protein [Acidobacteria bacterium]|nr:Rieske 2Fe-2S domain-containing protein [Acidobacteriota bacterium]
MTDLSTAATIPADWYLDVEMLETERRTVFSSTWQLAAHLDQLAEPGAYVSTEIAGEPVLIARGRDGELRAMSNVCRHRAGPVVTGNGTCRSFRCGYHGWVYGLDGQLLATREFEGVEHFEKSDHPLPRWNVGTWGPLVFVKLNDDGPSLAETFAGITERVELGDLDSFQFAHRKDWTMDCNWKVYVDNFLEGYHIPIVHPALNEELDYENYRVETLEWFSIQHSPIKSARRLRVSEDAGDAQYFWIYPNLMLNVYPDNFSTNLILPLGPDRTITVFEWFFRDPDHARTLIADTVEFSDEIQLEDIAICEAVQRGLRSRTYDTGRYSVARENGVHHFHELLRRSVG